MSTESLSKEDILSTLPCETLFEILSYLCPVGDGLALISTSKGLYKKLIVQLYKEAGRQLDWLPLLFGASEGNINTLERCDQAGAPLGHRWAYIGHCRGRGDPGGRFKFCQALDWAIWSGQEEARKWLIENKVVDKKKRLPELQGFEYEISMLAARSLVFDVRTPGAKGDWRPVLYQREVHQPDVYPYEPYRRSAHLVWYGPKIEPCLVFPRLLDILKGHCESSLPFHQVSDCLAIWISRFWLDMLLSSTSPVSVFESGFFKSTRRRDGKFHAHMGYDDMFGKASLIGNMVHNVSSPEFARHFSPRIFRLLLDSRVDIFLIASAYISIFENLVSNQRNAKDYVSTFRFYPLILRALIDSGTDTDKIETFCYEALSPLFVVSTCLFVDAVSKVLDDMGDCGASPADKAFAFSPLAEELLRRDPEELFTWPFLKDLVTSLSA
ncbi:uncharacterized protein NECHADRAFT_74039 [Fusarium vanettenii 77-13-4]|uniref:F-box domain-containing protein n=1 Tax=Fusarium vanettenii (strain ATCC MYA-4622 / CBS 123669 / FGSC 9596 / NRRL 45880 / 77-13-4) TaxID=660122 RepID=C7YVQ3_FUSV7|nr:uncharacterized protein NECHADRAFT_74039 [Fusarium vanettenii 77-13-4]EEU43832.1 predicted protein [Fusarium vanettenii 77-13-4]